MNQQLVGKNGCVLVKQNFMECHGWNLWNDYSSQCVGNGCIHSFEFNLQCLFGVIDDINSQTLFELSEIKNFIIEFWFGYFLLFEFKDFFIAHSFGKVNCQQLNRFIIIFNFKLFGFLLFYCNKFLIFYPLKSFLFVNMNKYLTSDIDLIFIVCRYQFFFLIKYLAKTKIKSFIKCNF